MASKKVLQNRINKIIEKMKTDPVCYPNVEITDDTYWNDESPILTVSTDYQIILFMVEDYENVFTKTRMRRGAGTEKEFTKKVNSLNELRKYVKRKFKGDEFQVKETLDNIKVTSVDTIYTLTYDCDTNEVVTKTRARRGTKKQANSSVISNNGPHKLPEDAPLPSDEFPNISIPTFATGNIEASIVVQSLPNDITNELKTAVSDELSSDQKLKQQVTGKLENVAKSVVSEPAAPNKQVAGKLESAAATKSFVPKRPKKQKDDPYICDGLTIADIHFVEEREYEEWPQGTIVANIYSEKHYTVQQDMKNVIEVSSAESGYQTIARADLRIVHSVH